MAAVFRKRGENAYICTDPHKAAPIIPNGKKFIVYDIIDNDYHGAIESPIEGDLNIKYYNLDGDFSGYGLIRSEMYEIEQEGPFITVE